MFLHLFYDRSCWRILSHLFLCILIVYIVTHSYKLSVSVRASQEDNSHTNQVFIWDLTWIWGFSLEDKTELGSPLQKEIDTIKIWGLHLLSTVTVYVIMSKYKNDDACRFHPKTTCNSLSKQNPLVESGSSKT